MKLVLRPPSCRGPVKWVAAACLALALAYAPTRQPASAVADSPAHQCASALINNSDEPSQKVDALAALAGMYVKAGDEKTASELLFRALKVAEEIEHPLFRAGAVWRVAEHGAAEHLEQALVFARALQPSDPDHRVWAYRELAEHFIRVGRSDRAVAVLDEAVPVAEATNRDREGRELDLSFLAQLYAQAGACARALELSRGFKNPARVSEIRSAAARCYGAKKQFRRGLEVSGGVSYPEMKIEALIDLARASDGPDERAARARAFAAALKVARRSEDYDPEQDSQVNALVSVAKGYDAAGQRADALRVLAEAASLVESVEKPGFRYAAGATVAAGFAELGSFEQALKAARAIKGDMERAGALVAVARRMAGSGDNARAAELLVQAARLADDHDCSYERPMELPDRADPSRTVVYNYSQCRSGKARIYAGVAEVNNARGAAGLAVELLDRARRVVTNPDGYYYNDAPLEPMAAAYLAAGQYGRALEMASAIGSPSERVTTVAAIENRMAAAKAEPDDAARAAYARLGCAQDQKR